MGQLEQRPPDRRANAASLSGAIGLPLDFDSTPEVRRGAVRVWLCSGSTPTREWALDSWGCSALPTRGSPMLRPTVVWPGLVKFPDDQARLVTQMLGPDDAVLGFVPSSWRARP